MTTTVHLPPELVAKLDQRARASGVSRNRYIRRALELAIERESAWSPRFLEMLGEAAKDGDAGKEVDDLLRTIALRRTRKRPPRL